MTLRPGAFLDRDGTIIEDTGFVRDPDRVRVIPGSAEAIRRLNTAGWPVVVVTNQSGIARGLLTEPEYRAVARRIEELLGSARASVDATYVCPHWPDISGPCECRKPGLLHYQAAMAVLDIDPARSVFVGDKLTDLEPARRLGGTGILVLTGEGRKWADSARQEGFGVAADLEAAVRHLAL